MEDMDMSPLLIAGILTAVDSIIDSDDDYESVCDRFNVGEATAIRAVRRVTLSILKLRNQFIKWPSDEEVPLINGDIEESANIPKVVGAIDGTHIKILAPKENVESYINIKSFHSIQLQVVCDNETRKFLHCFTGYPGSVNDQRVFKFSGMQELCNKAECFPEECHLIGDAAYVNQKRLLTPYRDNGH
ncbi:hypothetical protein MML48_9g00005771 [Holotrichia oblita]|uniref:Uncharacterized protein n=1 Tax=Holotrichia oblita TaxID=644536 RepID=A0ACB9SLM2_HOLOL|nr:hypothetical protein MML48_9g00005771 [Holotrichia oblita]